MANLNYLLNADWERLRRLSGAPLCPRRWRHIFSARFAPVAFIRFAQCLHAAGWPRLAKFPALANFVFFGLEVPPRMPIGAGLVIMHTHGTVLGASSIGSEVTIYHQVTLGAAEMDFSYTLSLRPVIEDNVVISAGAKVLGGLKLGRGCVVGANAVVLRDVPPGYVAVGIPARNLAPKEIRSQVALTN